MRSAGRMTATTVMVMVAVAMPVLSGAVARSGTESAGPVVYENCDERFYWGLGDAAAVRDAVPPAYEPVPDGPSGQPMLRVATSRCEGVQVPGGVPQPTTTVLLTAVIESPDGGGCLSNSPIVGDLNGDAVPNCNQYVLIWATDNAELVDWATDGIPDMPVTFVEDLSFDQDELDATRAGAPFHFEAGATTPWPFELDLLVRERPVPVPIQVSFWADTSVGTMKLTFATNDVALHEASGTLHVGAGTEMARLYNSEMPSEALSFSTIVGGIHWGRGELSKDLVTPSSP